MIISRRKIRVSVGTAALLTTGLAFLLPACTGPATSKSDAPVASAPAMPAAAPAKLALNWPEFQKKVLPFFKENCADYHEG